MNLPININDQQVISLCQKIENDHLQYLINSKLDCETNRNNGKVTAKDGKKYIKIDMGNLNNNYKSGKYMVEKETGKIFGIKAYGVIHKGHQYGTLDDIDSYFWGQYYATFKK